MEAVEETDLPSVAEYVREDIPKDRIPEGIDPTVEEIETLVRDAGVVNR